MLDVLIVGAGPAGSVAAIFLAEAGFKTLLVDKERFPRRKVCGEGITPRATRNLHALGLDDFLRTNAYRIDNFCFHLPDSKPIVVSCRLNKLYPPFAYTLSRSRLDLKLRQLALDKGAQLLEETKFLGLESKNNGTWRVLLEEKGGKPRTLEANFLIGADGAPSTVARCLGKTRRGHGPVGVALGCHMTGVKNLGRQLDFIWDRELLPGSGWIFPLGPDIANVGVGIIDYHHPQNKVNIKALWEKMLDSCPSATPRLRDAEMVDEPRMGLLPFYMFDINAVEDGCLLAGDAAGLVNPFGGEGITFALESGWLAARAIIGAWPRRSQDLLQHYWEELHLLYEVPFKVGGKVFPLTQNQVAIRALGRLMGGKPRLSSLLYPLIYRSGARRWRELVSSNGFTIDSKRTGKL